MLDRRRGRVLNVASTAAFLPGPNMAVYYATKAFVLSFSEAIGDELRDTGVTVTALCPGPTAHGVPARGGDAEIAAGSGSDHERGRRRGGGLPRHARRPGRRDSRGPRTDWPCLVRRCGWRWPLPRAASGTDRIAASGGIGVSWRAIRRADNYGWRISSIRILHPTVSLCIIDCALCSCALCIVHYVPSSLPCHA